MVRMVRLIGPFPVLLIVATAGAVEVNADATANRCGEDMEMTFVGWNNWTQVTPGPVVSQWHGDSWVGIFVDELAKDAYPSAGAAYLPAVGVSHAAT